MGHLHSLGAICTAMGHLHSLGAICTAMGLSVTLAILQDMSQPPKISQGGALCYSYSGHLAKYKLVIKELRPVRVGHCVTVTLAILQDMSQPPKTSLGGALCYIGHLAKYKLVTKDQSGWGTVTLATMQNTN